MDSAARLAALLKRAYDLEGELSPLAGEGENHLLTATDGRRYVLKLAPPELTVEQLEVEHLAVEAVNSARLGLDLPRLVPTRDGGVTAVDRDPKVGPRCARLLEFVAGVPWCWAGEPGPGRARELGRTCAKVDAALAGVESSAARSTHDWDLMAAGRHREKIPLVEGRTRRRLLEWAFHLHAAGALPPLRDLPRTLIHGDANDENVLVKGERITGLLDFGDCLVAPAACELAIALAYAMLGCADPLELGAEVVAGYCGEHPLGTDELAALFPLVIGRLAVTVAICAHRRRIDPERESWFVTEERAWALLAALAKLDPAEAGNALAAGTGMQPYPGPGAAPGPLRERRERVIAPSLSLAYPKPLKIVRGRGQYLFDERGQPFLDLVNNVCHVGHCHPRVVEAGQAQMARLNTNTRYLHDGLVDYAERLCATLPESLDTCFLVNSGSEANELALRLAMAHTGRRDLLVVDGAYHGHTAGLIAVSPYKFLGRGGAGQAEPWVHVVPLPDGYRGPHRGQGPEAGRAYGDKVGRVIEESGRPVAAFLSESLQSCGGQILPPEGYFQRAFEHVRAAGGLCILDEVQVGFGRVGTHFWAFEQQGVVPDLVVMGKPIGNGHPMAAVVTHREIAASLGDLNAGGMEFFSTFGGNPVSCAIGLAVLDVIRDEELQRHALEVGARLLDGLRGLMDSCPLIGEVRGSGLFLGVELVRDRESLEPATGEAEELVNRMVERNMLLSTDGPHHNVIKIKPPMVLDAGDVDMVVRCFGEVLPELG